MAKPIPVRVRSVSGAAPEGRTGARIREGTPEGAGSGKAADPRRVPAGNGLRGPAPPQAGFAAEEARRPSAPYPRARIGRCVFGRWASTVPPQSGFSTPPGRRLKAFTSSATWALSSASTVRLARASFTGKKSS